MQPILRVRDLRVAMNFASDDYSRPDLCALRIEPAPTPGRFVIVATNAHALIAIEREQEGLGDFEPATLVVGGKKTKNRPPTDLHLALANTTDDGVLILPDEMPEEWKPKGIMPLHSPEAGMTIEVTCLDSYPPWRRIVPRTSEGTDHLTLAPEYLGLLAATSKAYGCKGVTFSFNQHGAETAWMFTFEDVLVLLMPMRLKNYVGPDLDRWLGVERETSEEANQELSVSNT